MKISNFSNLYTSFEKTNEGHILRAYFGVDIFSLMQENLKFPTLYRKNDLLDYIQSIRIVPYMNDPHGGLLTTYFNSNLKYREEERHIEPELLSILGVEGNFTYFAFSQLFGPHRKRKYDFNMVLLDISVNKALNLRERAINFINTVDSMSKLDIVSQDLPDLTSLCYNLQDITGQNKEIYNRASKNNFLVTDRTYYLLKREMLQDISFIDQKIKIKTRNYGSAVGMSVSKRAAPVRQISHSFKIVVEPLLHENMTSDLNIENGLVVNREERTSVTYTKSLNIPTVVIKSLPSLENNFKRINKYEEDSTLKVKAPSLNIDFACLELVDSKSENTTRSNIRCVKSVDMDEIYILLSHSYASVSSPNFVLLSDFRTVLTTNSNYLCKTNFIDGENQYFILET